MSLNFHHCSNQKTAKNTCRGDSRVPIEPQNEISIRPQTSSDILLDWIVEHSISGRASGRRLAIYSIMASMPKRNRCRQKFEKCRIFHYPHTYVYTYTHIIHTYIWYIYLYIYIYIQVYKKERVLYFLLQNHYLH